ncbi:MAG TPA: hypothetical protein VHG90_00530 [Acidimicrobiales bacterium]|nr:hypothetical protein [Acidimicrobiales bacterium]
MIVLVLILVVAAIGGVAAYVVMQYSGMDSSFPRGGSPAARTWTYDRRGGALADRIADTPSGCLVAVLVALAAWIVAWLVFLIVGFRVLTA